MDTLDKLARSVQRPRILHERLYHLLLTGQTDQQNLYHGYRSLAALLYAGYFSLVLTTNDETMLEQALQERGLMPPDYQIVSIGCDPDEKVATALDGQESGICIVRLCVDEKTPLADEVRSSLQGFLQQNIVVVGYINGARQEIIKALTAKKDNSIYYVVPAEPASDAVPNLLQKQYQKQESFLIDGPNGEFVTFFEDLASRLLFNDFSAPESAIGSDKRRLSKNKQSLPFFPKKR